jgi:hypothetical protein
MGSSTMNSSLDKWRNLTQPPEVIEFFKGLFERVGIRVIDTAEEFSARHLGDRIEFEPTLDPGQVDYVVEIESSQIDRLAEHVQTGKLDETEQYRIVSALFTPATAAMLKSPVLSHPLLRWLAGVEDVIHVHLREAPAGEKEFQHTLIYANRQWLVLPGLQGQPRRVYKLNLQEALAYHRRAFEAMKINTWSAWMGFARWYREWRKGVSLPKVN